MNQNPGPPQGQPPGGPPGPAQRPAQGQYGQGAYGQGQYGQGQYGQGQPGTSGWGSYPPQGRLRPGINTARTPAVVAVARVMLGIAAAVSIAYGVFAVILLRAVYSDYEAGDATLGEVDDRLDIHNITVWVAIAVVVIALAAWAASVVTAKRGAQGLGIAGLVVTVVATVAVGFGLVRMTGADEGAAAATGALVAGTGFLAVALGLVLGLLAMRGRFDVSTPEGRYGAGGYGHQQQHGQGQYGQGQYGQQHGQGQYGQSPPGYRQPPGAYGQPRGQQPGSPQPGGQPPGGAPPAGGQPGQQPYGRPPGG
ncbi:MAG: hypothetical protein M3419_08145 [Actinomycetota bacterium]|nr:hypothetical protein [Actinomycetota bacterium]